MHAAEEMRVTSEQFAADLASEGMAVDSVASAKVSALVEVERLTLGGTFRIDGDPADGRSTSGATSGRSVMRPLNRRPP